jgi:hypothetical protein
LFTGTFYLLMIAIGLAFGGAWRWLAHRLPAGHRGRVVGVVATGLLHRSRFGRSANPGRGARPQRQPRHRPARDVVPAWDDGRRARVMYRGALWDVELGQGATARAGDFPHRRGAGQPARRRQS